MLNENGICMDAQFISFKETPRRKEYSGRVIMKGSVH